MAPLGSEKQRHLRDSLATICAGLAQTTLWAHQCECLIGLERHFAVDREDPHAICVIPTAGGKTEIFTHLLQTHHVRDAECPAAPSFLLVPKRNLVAQMMRALRRKGMGWALRRQKGQAFTIAPINVMTYSRFVSLVAAGAISPEEAGLLVLDEAHCGLSDTRKPAIKRFIGLCPIIAFSATPAYDLMKSVYALLGEDNEIINVTAERLRRDRVIAPAINYILEVALDGEMPDEAGLARRILRQAAQNAVLEFQQTFRDPDLPMQIYEKPFLGYHASIAQANEATAAYNSLIASDAPPCQTLSGADSVTEQRHTIDRLNDGRLSGLNNAILLVEGTNIPRVGAILNFQPTYSLVRQVQRCGRAMRLDPQYTPDDPRQTAYVVDLYFKINGQMVGQPRFYFEVINDTTIVRQARGVAQSIAEIQNLLTFTGRPPLTTERPDRYGRKPAAAAMGPRASSGYSVTSGLVAVQHLLSERDGVDPNAEYNLAYSWITRTDISNRTALSAEIEGRFEALETEFLAWITGGRAEPVTRIDPQTGLKTPVHMALRRPSAQTKSRIRGRRHVVYRADQRDLIARIVGLESGLPRLGDEWLSIRSAFKSIGMVDSDRVVTVLSGIFNQFKVDHPETTDEQIVMWQGKALRVRRVARWIRGKQTIVCMHRDSVLEFLATFGFGPRLADHPDWLGMSDLTDLESYPRRLHSTVRANWDGLVAQVQRGQPILWGDRPLKFEIRRTKKGAHLGYVHRSDAEAVRELLQRPLEYPLADSTWLTAKGFAQQTGADRSQRTRIDHLYRSVWKTLAGRADGDLSLGGQTLRIGLRQDQDALMPVISAAHAADLRRMLDDGTIPFKKIHIGWADIEVARRCLGLQTDDRLKPVWTMIEEGLDRGTAITVSGAVITAEWRSRTQQPRLAAVDMASLKPIATALGLSVSADPERARNRAFAQIYKQRRREGRK